MLGESIRLVFKSRTGQLLRLTVRVPAHKAGDLLKLSDGYELVGAVKVAPEVIPFAPFKERKRG